MPRTYSILREAVEPANRETFKNNLIAFMNEYNLDEMDRLGVSGSSRYPRIPSDDPVNGLNYYRLLSSIKSAYLVDIQVTLFEISLNKYKDLINNGYNNKFQVYKKYVKEEIPD
ncbi:hypothetical protein VTI74DRAFT_4793 [Chaetomium olivicolor]